MPVAATSAKYGALINKFPPANLIVTLAHARGLIRSSAVDV